MAKQLHKRFSAEEVKTLFRKYLYEGIELIYILETLKIKKSRFFNLLKEYARDPNKNKRRCRKEHYQRVKGRKKADRG